MRASVPVVRSVRSFVRSIDCSFVRWFVHSVVRSLVRSIDCSFVCSFVRSIDHSVVSRPINTSQFQLTNIFLFCFPRSSPLVEEFTSRFPGMSLLNVLSEFSLPTPLSEHNNPLGLPQQQVHTQAVTREGEQRKSSLVLSSPLDFGTPCNESFKFYLSQH